MARRRSAEAEMVDQCWPARAATSVESPDWIADPVLAERLIVTEVADGPAFAEPIFQRKYAQSAPDFPHHVVAFLRDDDGSFVAASYLHFRPWNGLMMVGGGATDGRAFSRLPENVGTAVRASGGLLLQTLRYGFRRFADDCEAFFGYCGDPRAFEVDMQSGFQPAGEPYLLVYWHRLLSEARRRERIAEVKALGPF